MSIKEHLEQLREFTNGALYISSDDSILDFLNGIIDRIDIIMDLQLSEPDYDAQRGISVPVDMGNEHE